MGGGGGGEGGVSVTHKFLRPKIWRFGAISFVAKLLDNVIIYTLFKIWDCFLYNSFIFQIFVYLLDLLNFLLFEPIDTCFLLNSKTFSANFAVDKRRRPK